MRWPEALVLSVVAAGATAAAIASGFDPLAVYVGVIGWGGARTVGNE